MKSRSTLAPAALALTFGLAACGGAGTMDAGSTPAPEAPAAATTFPSEPPAPLPVEDVDFPEYEERTLRNGARVLVVPNDEQPVVTYQLVIPGGSAADPADMAGLASMTATLLNKGTETRSAEEIAEGFDFLGASFGGGASNEWTNLFLTTLTDFSDQALDLMADVVLNPTFPAGELETEKRRRISSLRLQRSQPASLAQESFLEGLYGDHPYGRSATIQTIEAIDAEDLEAFHDAHFRPGEALFVVAGAVDADEAARQLERAFAGWEGAPAPVKAAAEPPSPTDRRMVFVHKPGSVQAVIRMGHLFPDATHPDWVALDVANQVLGSGSAQFNAWMMEILREQKGYTYGAYSSMAERRGPGYFMMTGEYRNEVADSALMIMVDLAERLRAGDIPADDLEDAQLYLTGSFPLGIETPQQVAGQVASNRLLGREDAYLEEYRGRVADVGSQDVARVASEHIHPERMLIVVVGDATQVLDRVRPFADRVEVVDAEGDPVDVEAIMAAATRSAEMTFDASDLRPREMRYALMFQGNEMGQILVRWTRSDNVFAVVTEQSLPGVQLEQTTEFDALTFAPIRIRTSAPPVGDLAIEVDEGRATGTGFNLQQGPQPVDLEVNPGTALEGQFDIALAVTDYEDVGDFTLDVLTAAGTVQPMNVSVAGQETVEVPAGSYETYRLELGGQQPMTVWVTQSEPHIVVKRELAGQPVSIVLTSM